VSGTSDHFADEFGFLEFKSVGEPAADNVDVVLDRKATKSWSIAPKEQIEQPTKALQLACFLLID
jgi:hypothetical protein